MVEVFAIDIITLEIGTISKYIQISNTNDLKDFHQMFDDSFLFVECKNSPTKRFYAIDKKRLLTEIDLLEIFDKGENTHE